MKLYILVDNNLTWQHRAVQAAHAVAEYMKQTPDTPWYNGTLVLLGSDDINQDAEQCDVVWREPFWQNRITAAASLEGSLWRNHKLL